MNGYKEFKKDLFVLIVIASIFTKVLNAFNFGFDSTDDRKNNKRSGMVLYVDNLTGCHYLQGGLFGGISKRYDRNGKHICIGK